MAKQEHGAEYWIETLGLSPHGEGGWYREIWTADLTLSREALPEAYGGSRSACSLIYYLLREGEISVWHKLRSGEIWTWHQGGVLEQTLGGRGEAPLAEPVQLLGPDPERGERFQGIVPAGVWQTTRIREGGFVLVSCIVAPAFRPEDFFLPPN
jgi:predicted cupin superfamily sugar epimerase